MEIYETQKSISNPDFLFVCLHNRKYLDASNPNWKHRCVCCECHSERQIQKLSPEKNKINLKLDLFKWFYYLQTLHWVRAVCVLAVCVCNEPQPIRSILLSFQLSPHITAADSIPFLWTFRNERGKIEEFLTRIPQTCGSPSVILTPSFNAWNKPFVNSTQHMKYDPDEFLRCFFSFVFVFT